MGAKRKNHGIKLKNVNKRVGVGKLRLRKQGRGGSGKGEKNQGLQELKGSVDSRKKKTLGVHQNGAATKKGFGRGRFGRKVLRGSRGGGERGGTRKVVAKKAIFGSRGKRKQVKMICANGKSSHIQGGGDRGETGVVEANPLRRFDCSIEGGSTAHGVKERRERRPREAVAPGEKFGSQVG